MPFYAQTSDSLLFSTDSVLWAGQLDAAEVAARVAIALDPDNASATIALANVLRDRWEWEPAEAAYLKALNLDPDNVEVHQQYAEYLHYMGRMDESLQAARRALALDRSPVRLNVAGYIAKDNGLFDESIELFEEAVRKDPEGRLGFMRANLLSVYVMSGDWDRAWRVAAEYLGEERTAELRIIWPVSGPPPVGMDVDAWPGLVRTKAFLWQVLRQPDRALATLERLGDLRAPFGSPGVLRLLVFEPLRDDPRFQAILAKRGLAGRRAIRAGS